MPPLVPLLREVVCTTNPEKALFVVRSRTNDEIKGLACSVKKSGKFFLVTCTDVANPEDTGRNDGNELNADRFCTQYPRHRNKHRLQIQDIRSDDKFCFTPLAKIPDITFPLYETMKGHFIKPCHSFAVTDNKKLKRVEWSYNPTTYRHVTTGYADLEKSSILGSPVLWTDDKDTTFVVGVVGSEDKTLFPMFFDKSSLQVPDLPRAATLGELPKEVFADKITLRWNRSEDAPNYYKVYQMIDNQDAQWERVKTTTDNACDIRVERGKSYQFKVTGVKTVNGNDLEGKESNITRVKVPDVPMPVEIIDLPSEISGNELTLKWSKPGDNGTPITHYTVYQRILNEDGSAPADWTRLMQVKQPLEYEVSGMETGKTYEFQVTATNKCGEGPKVPEAIKRVTVLIDEPPEDLFSFLHRVLSWMVSFLQD